MRADHGLLAGIGTSVSLVAAGAIVLSVLSAFIAFDGWPGTQVAKSTPMAVLADGPAPVAPVGGSAQTVAAATSDPMVLRAAPAPAGSRQAKVAVRRMQRERRLQQQARRRRGPSLDPEAAGASFSELPRDPGTSGRRGRPAWQGSAGDTVRDVTRGSGQVLHGTAKSADQIVTPAAPEVGRSVGEAGRAVEEIVQQTGEGIGRALDGPALP